MRTARLQAIENLADCFDDWLAGLPHVVGEGPVLSCEAFQRFHCVRASASLAAELLADDGVVGQGRAERLLSGAEAVERAAIRLQAFFDAMSEEHRTDYSGISIEQRQAIPFLPNHDDDHLMAYAIEHAAKLEQSGVSAEESSRSAARVIAINYEARQEAAQRAGNQIDAMLARLEWRSEDKQQIRQQAIADIFGAEGASNHWPQLVKRIGEPAIDLAFDAFWDALNPMIAAMSAPADPAATPPPIQLADIEQAIAKTLAANNPSPRPTSSGPTSIEEIRGAIVLHKSKNPQMTVTDLARIMGKDRGNLSRRIDDTDDLRKLWAALENLDTVDRQTQQRSGQRSHRTNADRMRQGLDEDED